MKSVASLLAVLSLASIANAAPFDTATCICYVNVDWTQIDGAELLKDMFNDSPKTETCDQQGLDDCVAYCEQKVGEISNDFTLLLPPKIPGATDVPLGQYLCNILGQNIDNAHVTLQSKIQCTRPGFNVSRSHIDGRTSTRERLNCKNGKFIEE